MLYKIVWDELYPYYYITSSRYFDKEIELTDEELAFVEKAHRDFWQAQDFLSKKIHPNGL